MNRTDVDNVGRKTKNENVGVLRDGETWQWKQRFL